MHAFRYSKIEKRLDFVYLPDTLQIQFMGAHQNHSEQLEDCTDKLLSLATKAFRDLPEDHIYTQAWRLCQCRFDNTTYMGVFFNFGTNLLLFVALSNNLPSFFPHQSTYCCSIYKRLTRYIFWICKGGVHFSCSISAYHH